MHALYSQYELEHGEMIFKGKQLDTIIMKELTQLGYDPTIEHVASKPEIEKEIREILREVPVKPS